MVWAPITTDLAFYCCPPLTVLATPILLFLHWHFAVTISRDSHVTCLFTSFRSSLNCHLLNRPSLISLFQIATVYPCLILPALPVSLLFFQSPSVICFPCLSPLHWKMSSMRVQIFLCFVHKYGNVGWGKGYLLALPNMSFFSCCILATEMGK